MANKRFKELYENMKYIVWTQLTWIPLQTNNVKDSIDWPMFWNICFLLFFELSAIMVTSTVIPFFFTRVKRYYFYMNNNMLSMWSLTKSHVMSKQFFVDVIEKRNKKLYVRLWLWFRRNTAMTCWCVSDGCWLYTDYLCFYSTLVLIIIYLTIYY